MPDAPAASMPSSSDMRPADLAIIGAGPVGLFAAFYAGLRQMSVTLIDSLDVDTGKALLEGSLDGLELIAITNSVGHDLSFGFGLVIILLRGGRETGLHCTRG